MRAAIIQNGVVTNIIEVESLSQFPGLVEATGAAIGDLWNGSTFAKPVPSAPIVPEWVPMLDAHLTLIDAGLYDQVDAYFAGLTGTQGAKDRAFWLRAQKVRRDDPRVEAMRVQLQKTHAEIDALFIDAGARG